MIALARNFSASPAVEERFLELLPMIRRRAQTAFRDWDVEAREDAVTEVVANSFVAFARLAARGKVEIAFATALARFAVRQFHAGRRVGNRFTIRDVLSSAARRRRGLVVERLDRVDPATGEWLEAVVNDYSTPVADQAAFRCDFPAWLGKQRPRDRRIAAALALGHTTADVARQFRISAGRVSQLRRELRNSWLAFHGDERGVIGS
jgi:hypothetical protein